MATAWLRGGSVAEAHVFVPAEFFLGAFPDYPGNGWQGEIFLIPDVHADNLIFAEAYIHKRTADATFRTDWIDYPAGATALGFDADFETIGDFLNDYIYQVSNPSILDEPFQNILVRFSGYIRVQIEHDSSSGVGLPVWVDYRTIGQDGFRLFVGLSIYRFPLLTIEDFFWQENPIHEIPGMYRAEFTLFNKYDPFGSFRTELAGMELYTFHGGGLELPGGFDMTSKTHPEFGQGTIIPPTVIYSFEDIITPAPMGDFDRDADTDLRDVQFLQNCYSGEPKGFPILPDGCSAFDFDDDDDVDTSDYVNFVTLIE